MKETNVYLAAKEGMKPKEEESMIQKLHIALQKLSIFDEDIYSYVQVFA